MAWLKSGAPCPPRCLSAAAALLAGILAIAPAGCASPGIGGRRAERAAAYAELPPETQASVDAGQVQVGMPMDAVYIAWGKPTRILRSKAASGQQVKWIYHGVRSQPYRYWRAEGVSSRHGYVPQYELAHGWQPEYFLQAEVVFENGRVTECRTFRSSGVGVR